MGGSLPGLVLAIDTSTSSGQCPDLSSRWDSEEIRRCYFGGLECMFTISACPAREARCMAESPLELMPCQQAKTSEQRTEEE